jgi:hypothetical protein
MTPGYSGKPLPDKLGVKPGMNALFFAAPEDVVEPWRATLAEADTLLDFAMIFATRRVDLESALQQTRPKLKENGMIWAAWPKKASKVPTDITEDTIRDLAFPLDLVDVKVCAVSETWSGLKLVIRLSHRKAGN